jgi:hypothetical protein
VIEPPPLEPEYRELWSAAVALLQQNMDLSSHSDNGDLAFLSDNSDDECENGSYGAGA